MYMESVSGCIKEVEGDWRRSNIFTAEFAP